MCEPKLYIPELNITLMPGMSIKLHRFEDHYWKVNFGWYSFGGNREVCGWYLTSIDDPSIVKPLQRPDTYDIYLIER